MPDYSSSDAPVAAEPPLPSKPAAGAADTNEHPIFSEVGRRDALAECYEDFRAKMLGENEIKCVAGALRCIRVAAEWCHSSDQKAEAKRLMRALDVMREKRRGGAHSNSAVQPPGIAGASKATH